MCCCGGRAGLVMMKIEALWCNMLICLFDGSFFKDFFQGDKNIWKNQIQFPQQNPRL